MISREIQTQKKEKISNLLDAIYPNRSQEIAPKVFERIENFTTSKETAGPSPKWSEKDVVLITYGDMVKKENEAPLKTLSDFCAEHLKKSFSTVHILPFFPYSSDDGFSVIDYTAVDPNLGDWPEIEALGKDFSLMFDLVLNHCSCQHVWFEQFLSEQSPGKDYFHSFDEEFDTSYITRPRSSPLLTKFGEKYLWTTFSEDQIDLNFGNPDVLLKFINILLDYIKKGARIIRLDAIAYAWKKIGTCSIHLPEVHALVKLLHAICECVAPQAILITETNVPHTENISYFGDGDEADMVYNFSLSPLLLQALARGNAQYLTKWAKNLAPPPAGCTFFNFTASHDGIGVRPLTGLLPDEEISALVAKIKANGGHVSKKKDSDGTESPYELNITYIDALADPGSFTLNTDRFMCSQILMLSFRGVPAVYFHSLIGTHNYTKGVDRTGQPRTINRYKWSKEKLLSLLEDPTCQHSKIFSRYKKILEIRNVQPAFHPDAPQAIHDVGSELFVLERNALDAQQTILCVYNVTENDQLVPKDILGKFTNPVDLLTGDAVLEKLIPYQAVWITEN